MNKIFLIFVCVFLFFLQACQTYNPYLEPAYEHCSSPDSKTCGYSWTEYNNKLIAKYHKKGTTKKLLTNNSDKKIIEKDKINISSLNNKQLCSKATIGSNEEKRWDNSASFSLYVLEAKRRGISCEVGKTSIKDMSNRELCSQSTHYDGGVLKWETSLDFKKYVKEAKQRRLTCGVKEENKTIIASNSNNTKPSISSSELKKEKTKRLEEERKRKALEQRIAELEKKNKELQKSKQEQPPKSRGGSGSGFFISKLGHIITNEHVVKKCNKITVGDNIDRQVPARLIQLDRKNDLALLRTTTLDLASSETKSLIKKLSTQKLGIEIVPLATAGLMRSDDVELGEQIVVAGFPYGDIFSKDIKVTFGNVNSTKGVGDDSSQFQIQAPVQIGNSGGPIYDKYGNIVGVVVAQLDKLKMAKTIGSLPENVNFGIKASTVKQFLNSSGLPTKWAERNKKMSDKDISQIASKQTVMVVCHR